MAGSIEDVNETLSTVQFESELDPSDYPDREVKEYDDDQIFTTVESANRPLLTPDSDDEFFNKTSFTRFCVDQPVIPYLDIYKPPQGFKSHKRRCILPNVPIRVKIFEYVRDTSRNHLLNPNLYTIRVTHGDQTWKIHRRYKHFLHLQEHLLIFQTAIRVPIPSREHKLRRRSMHQHKDYLPWFPKKPDAVVRPEDMDNRMRNLETYLDKTLRSALYRSHPDMLRFLEISPYSFVHELGDKGKEGVVKKRSGGRRISLRGCCGCFGKITTAGKWDKRWLVVKDTCVFYLRMNDGRIGDVMLMDRDFNVMCGDKETGEKNGLLITNLSWHLLVKCWTKRKAREWAEHITEKMLSTGRDFTLTNRFNSYAPRRPDTHAQWFIDGASYFNAVSSALEHAKEEIFITDWWLSPEIYMKRPVTEGDNWRLDCILKRKAEQGVRIFVLLWKELEIAVGINSFYSKQALIHKHKNIKVLRHPDHVSLWAHHEKMVVIDQKVAFVGGLDLCFGRWDDSGHSLTDLGSVSVSRSDQNSNRRGSRQEAKVVISDASDFEDIILRHHNVPKAVPPEVIIQDASIGHGSGDSEGFDVTDDNASLPMGPLPTTRQTELERQSCFLHLETIPEAEVTQLTQIAASRASDPTKPSTPKPSRRRFAEMTGKLMKTIHSLPQQRRKSTQFSGGNVNLDDIVVDDGDGAMSQLKVTYYSKEMASLTLGLHGSPKMWVGKDYTNFIVKDFVDLDMPLEDFIDRNTVPRMPWHDIGAVVYGKAARDVARHFIQRWNFTKLTKMKENIEYPLLIPKTYDQITAIPQTILDITTCCNCQVLRSADAWSAGIKHKEHSIMNAYIHCIENAKHFIYIENQFFITMIDSNKVTNGIAQALYDRICKAHKNGQKFRVYVIMPLLPAFEGEVGTARGHSIQAITHWNYQSMCRGGKSLVERLAQAVGDPTEYISFYGLRTYDELNGQLVTELIYVHSKMMIVDDRTVIIGSANINDRSMLGERDSEMAIVFEDKETYRTHFNGVEFRAGKFASTLRMMLMKEHLGLLSLLTNNSIDVSDPVCDEFYKNTWIKHAAKNTNIFEKVFKCIPTDEVCSFAQLSNYQKQTPLCQTNQKEARRKLHDIQGRIILFPLMFLCQENLVPPTGSKESLMPYYIWT